MINYVFNTLLCVLEVDNFNPCNHDVDKKWSFLWMPMEMVEISLG